MIVLDDAVCCNTTRTMRWESVDAYITRSSVQHAPSLCRAGSRALVGRCSSSGDVPSRAGSCTCNSNDSSHSLLLGTLFSIISDGEAAASHLHQQQQLCHGRTWKVRASGRWTLHLYFHPARWFLRHSQRCRYACPTAAAAAGPTPFGVEDQSREQSSGRDDPSLDCGTSGQGC